MLFSESQTDQKVVPSNGLAKYCKSLERHLNGMADLTPDIVNIIGVHDPHNMLEPGSPPSTMVKPVQMLRLFQYGHVCLCKTIEQCSFHATG